MGHLRSRFSIHLPANPPVRPPRIRPKSLFRNHLPVAALFPILCTGNPSYPQQNKDSRGRGEGVPQKNRAQISSCPPCLRGEPLLQAFAMKLGTVIQDECPHDTMSGPVRPAASSSGFGTS